MEILSLDLHSCPEEFMEKFLDFQETTHRFYRSDEVLESKEFRRKNLRVPPKVNRFVKHIFAIEDNIIVGSLYITFSRPEVDTNPDFISFYILVHPEYQGKGVAKSLLREGAEVAKEVDRRMISVSTRTDVDEKSKQWILKIGGKRVLLEITNRLYRDNVNWKYIEDILGRPDLSAYSYKKMSLEEINDRLIKDQEFGQELADFYTEVGNLVPRGSSQIEDEVVTRQDLINSFERMLKGYWRQLTIFCFDGDKIVGYTDCFYPHNTAVKRIATGLTGVRKSYQKQGIASRLKALITKHLFDVYPDLVYIDTENADYNQGMLKINSNLGYKKAQEWEVFEIPLSKIEEYLT